VSAKNRHIRRLGDSGGRQFITHGMPRRIPRDLFHRFMTASWPVIFGALSAYYMLFNLLFAAIYSLQPDDIANLNPAGYWGRFFFSVETFATVGYGDMHPRTLFAHIVAAIEIFIGLMTLALMTGMMFARFSKPTARFVFASRAVVRPINGKPTLMLRAANARQNIVMEAAAHLRMVRNEVTPEGWRIRRIQDLPLVRDRHPIFLFGWNLQHVIDANSPLADATEESMRNADAYLLLTVTGTDENTGQSLMARHEYPASAIHWNHTFVDILSTDAAGIDHFDYTRFQDIEPLG